MNKTPKMNPAEERVIHTLWVGNISALAALCVLALILAPMKSVVGVLAGGILALANFRLLELALKKAFLNGKPHGVMGALLIKYYLRFAATGLLLWLLISENLVEPLGLLAGLSVVVISTIALTLINTRKAHIQKACKEA